MAGKTDNLGWTNLHHAVANGFPNLVHSLLELREEIVNMPDVYGRTPLHLACSNVPLYSIKALNETENIIELLLSRGADFQTLDNTGKSPFHCLIDHWLKNKYPLNKNGKTIITQFLQCGADINHKDGNGRTPLHYLAGSPEMKVPLAKTLDEEREFIWPIINNEVLSARRRIRNDEILNAIRCITYDEILNARRQIGVHEILNAMSERVSKESNLTNNLTKLIPENHLYMKESLACLLSSRADINAADQEGNTPLHLAIVANKFEIVKELLVRKPNINAKNNEGQTPLHHAVLDEDKFINCAILLLHKGALANIVDVVGHTPVDIAINRWDFPCFLKHLILLIDVKMHPEMELNTEKRSIYEEMKKQYKRQCEDLNTFFELSGKSQLSLILRSHNFPVYTENVFIQTKLESNGFDERFPDYADFLKNKFAQDQNIRKMIENCTCIFSCFGEQFQSTTNGPSVYNRYSHWENLPVELKLKILSYLNNDELEYLKKQLGSHPEALVGTYIKYIVVRHLDEPKATFTRASFYRGDSWEGKINVILLNPPADSTRIINCLNKCFVE